MAHLPVWSSESLIQQTAIHDANLRGNQLFTEIRFPFCRSEKTVMQTDSGTASSGFVPQKTALGAEVITQRDAGLTYTMRRVLLLADGVRTVGELVKMLPGQNVTAELNELVERGLAEINMASGVISDLERVQDQEEARQAMSRWYRALRESRNGRSQADALRVQVSQMLRGSQSSSA
jgi:hypothetical protein